MSWGVKTINELYSIKGGKRLPKGVMLQTTPNKHPYIRITDMKDGKVLNLVDSFMYVPEAVVSTISSYRVKQSDLILSIVGQIGSINIVGETLDGANLTENCVKLIPLSNTVDSNFVYYYLKSDEGQDKIDQRVVGSTQPKLPIYNIQTLDIPFPPLPEQKAIASVLSSLDDKIDLLHRQNKTLEAMAETLFRQWFIEEAKEDWEDKQLGTLLTVKRGGSPRPIQDYLSDSGYRWLKISDVTSLNSPFVFNIKEHIKEEGLSKTTLLQAGKLVLSNSATPAIPKILMVDTCIHDGWLHFPVSTYSNEYLYLLFNHIRPELLQLGNGSIFTNLKTDILKEYVVKHPDEATLLKFQTVIEPIFTKLLENAKQIQTLEKLRDTLLPKLMSGEVRVQYQTEEVA
ncbi:restriction endonuclease subunit S [Acinetobacter baumannii]